MADVKLAAYPLPLVEAMLTFAGPGIRKALLDGQVIAAAAPDDAFEAWLMERWLKEIRSPEFTAGAEGQYLIAEWERGR